MRWMSLTLAKWIHKYDSKTRSTEQEQIHQTTCRRLNVAYHARTTECTHTDKPPERQQEMRLSQMKHGVLVRQTALMGCMQYMKYCLSICSWVMYLRWFRESLLLEFCHSFCRSGFYPGSLFVTSNTSSYKEAHNVVGNVAEKIGLIRRSVLNVHHFYKIQSFLSRHYEEPWRTPTFF